MELLEMIGRALAKDEGYAYDPTPYDERAQAVLDLPEMQRMIQITRDYDKARLGHDIRSDTAT